MPLWTRVGLYAPSKGGERAKAPAATFPSSMFWNWQPKANFRTGPRYRALMSRMNRPTPMGHQRPTPMGRLMPNQPTIPGQRLSYLTRGQARGQVRVLSKYPPRLGLALRPPLRRVQESLGCIRKTCEQEGSRGCLCRHHPSGRRPHNRPRSIMGSKRQARQKRMPLEMWLSAEKFDDANRRPLPSLPKVRKGATRRGANIEEINSEGRLVCVTLK